MIVGSFLLGAAVVWSLRAPVVLAGVGAGLADTPEQSFTIDGDLVEPMYPGGSVPLNLTITNPLPTDLGVSRLHVEIHAVDAPNATTSHPCVIGDFTVAQLVGDDELIVVARTTTTLIELGVPRENWPRVQMLDTGANQDGCKHASFKLAYSAVGRMLE